MATFSGVRGGSMAELGGSYVVLLVILWRVFILFLSSTFGEVLSAISQSILVC